MRSGDRVLLDMQNGHDFVIACFAILRADAVVVPVSPMNLTEELRHYIEDSDAKVAIVDRRMASRFAGLRACLWIMWMVSRRRNSGQPRPSSQNPTTCA